jgi:hypothetical protein
MTLSQLKERLEILIADGHGLKQVLLHIEDANYYEAYVDSVDIENDDVTIRG